jgi:predicted small lipoprotein YifL
MISFTRSLVLLGALAGTLAGCGTSNGLPGIAPYVKVNSPSDNSTAKLAVDKQVAINFDTNYTLKAPGTCAGLANCGHVYVLIDSTSCNTAQMAYNTLASSSPTTADFSKCMTATGQHAVTLELRHDDGSSVLNVLNNPVTAKVTITTEL